MLLNEILLNEKWNKKYKNSINCEKPKRFSKRAHYLGKLKKKKNIKENLRDWFKEKWIDISRKEGGKHPSCGASHKLKIRIKNKKHAYPKCLPKNKAKNLSKEKKKKLVSRKRRKVLTKQKGKKPVWTKNK